MTANTHRNINRLNFRSNSIHVLEYTECYYSLSVPKESEPASSVSAMKKKRREINSRENISDTLSHYFPGSRVSSVLVTDFSLFTILNWASVQRRKRPKDHK